MEVVGGVGVVPPLLVEEFLQQKARRILQDRTQQHGAHQLHRQTAAKGPQEKVDGHHAQAVNGAQGAV